MRSKNIFLFLFGIFSLLLLYGCSFDKFGDYLNDSVKRKYNSMEQEQKKMCTLDKFKSLSKKMGYEIEDVTYFDKANIKNLTFDKSNIKTLTLAKKSNSEIKFYETKDNKVSMNLFNSYKKNFEKETKESGNNSIYTGEIAVTGENSDYFSVQIRNDYIVIYRFYTYFIHLTSDLSNKKESKELLKELGCYKTVSLCLDSAFEATVKCLFDPPSKSNKTKDSIFVETPEEFKEIAFPYRFKTCEECGLKSEEYNKPPKAIQSKIKRSTVLIDSTDLNDISFSKFIEFEDKKSAEEYIEINKNSELNLKNKESLDVSTKEVNNGEAKRTIIANISEKDKGDLGAMVYIYSQRGCNVIEIVNVGAEVKDRYKMLDDMGY